MRKLELDLHQSMLKELELLKMKDLVSEKSVECCYQLSSTYWFQVRQMVSSYQFQSEEDEIDFFKNIHPLFTSEIEYYKLLFHAALFVPPDEEEARKFWQRENLRLDRFLENQADFTGYMLGGMTCHDKDYFLRRNLKVNNDLKPGVELQEIDTFTNGDALMAEFLSLQKYTRYVQTQLDKGSSNSGKP